LYDCNVKIIYALSPQAKGKIERPYQWLQDRLVRICVRENVTDIVQAQKILGQEIHRYNSPSGSFYNSGNPLSQIPECS